MKTTTLEGIPHTVIHTNVALCRPHTDSFEGNGYPILRQFTPLQKHHHQDRDPAICEVSQCGRLACRVVELRVVSSPMFKTNRERELAQEERIKRIKQDALRRAIQLLRRDPHRQVSANYARLPLMPDWFEYPDWSHRKCSELATRLERHLSEQS